MLAVAAKKANLHLLEDFLSETGLKVDIVSDPADFDTILDPDDPPEFALVDVDGYGSEIWELVDRLNELDVPVVVLARYRTQQVQQATLSHPVRSVLEKPVRKAQLEAIVETLSD